MMFRIRCYDHITDALISFHRLPAPEPFLFKTAAADLRSLNGSAPSYLSSLVSMYLVDGSSVSFLQPSDNIDVLSHCSRLTVQFSSLLSSTDLLRCNRICDDIRLTEERFFLAFSSLRRQPMEPGAVLAQKFWGGGWALPRQPLHHRVHFLHSPKPKKRTSYRPTFEIYH